MMESSFWRKVSIGDGCWTWGGARCSSGYGSYWSHGKCRGAHRHAYEIWNGEAPGIFYVCHTCDNRACVRPSHLFLTTAQGNAQDRARKQRGNQGERHHSAKLCWDDVRSMRRQYEAGGLTYRDLAGTFGVTAPTIRDAITRRTWKPY
jgi:hypothetical protein